MRTLKRWWLAWGGLVVLAGCGHSPSTPLEKGQAHYRAAEWDAAVASCDEILRESPQAIDALLLRGRARLAAKQIEAAVGDFSDVIRLAPNDPEAYYQRALAYEALGKNDESAADRNHARAIDRQDAALLRRHAESIRMPEMVRTEPAKKKAASESDDEPREDDDSFSSFDVRKDSAVNADTTVDRPIFGPLTENSGAGTKAPSIVGGVSRIFESPFVPAPAKAAAKAPSDASDEKQKEKSKPAGTSPGQTGQNFRADPAGPRDGLGPAADPEPIRIHGRPPVGEGVRSGGSVSDELGVADPTWKQPKYPTARLNFVSPLVGFGVPNKPGATSPGVQSPAGRLQSGFSDLAQPQSGGNSQPVVLAPQLRGFTPDSPPLPFVPPTPTVPGRLPQPSPAPPGR